MFAFLLALIQIASYFISLILAGYALSRSRFHPFSILKAGILASYALIQMDQFLGQNFGAESEWISRLLWFAYPIPVVLMARVAIWLKPAPELDLNWDRIWWTGLLPLTMLLVFGGWVGDDLVNFASHSPGELYWVYALYNVIFAGFTLGLLHANYRQVSPADRMKKVYGWLCVAGWGYLGSMLFLLLGILPPEWVFALILTDIILLGIAGIAYEAISEGQQVQIDLTMTLIKGSVVTLLVVMPWAVALMASQVKTLPLGLALFFSQGIIALGIPLLDDLDSLLERLVLGRRNTQREQLRSLLITTSVKNLHPTPAIPLNEDEFIRLTRRALSHMPNLPRLAASPLVEMKLVAQRIDTKANSLERAQELRALLAECIQALRPQDRGEYGTSDEWRFFNALYYPYVIGLSPYKQANFGKFDPATSEVMRWFQVAVPPRTLYNWQNRGAEMIAQILLEQEKGY